MRGLLLVYNLLFPIIFLVMLPGFALRMVRRGNYRHKFGQRLGIYSERVRSKLSTQRWTWIHAVSVGEVNIALKLIEVLREKEPDLAVALSTTTSTGYRLAHKHRSDLLEPIYHPLDLPWVTRRAFALLRPERLILIEAEVWPNQVAHAKRLGIPRYLVNARLSPRSFRRYRIVKKFAAPLFNSLTKVCLQDPEDEHRWRALGVTKERLQLTGSIKFDQAVPTERQQDFRPLLGQLGIPEQAPILLGGSTFGGEELLLAQAARALRKEFPEIFLLVVPRHAERGQQILTELAAHGFDAALRTELPSRRPELLIVNSTGELKDWYHCADIVFVGKSLGTKASGGQNPVEPLVANKPVIFGPAMQNFAVLTSQLLREKGALEVQSGSDLVSAVTELLRHPQQARELVEAGQKCLAVHHGATQRTADLILS